MTHKRSNFIRFVSYKICGSIINRVLKTKKKKTNLIQKNLFVVDTFYRLNVKVVKICNAGHIFLLVHVNVAMIDA